MAEFAQYREISNRLKKRFNLIRKPNLKEASESFRKLSTQLSPFPAYSGYCMYSAAKCEHQIVGSLKEQLSQLLSSSSLTTTGTTRSIPSTSITSKNSHSSSSRANQALENLVTGALWTEYQTWLDTARIFRQIDSMENDLNGTISSYAHAIQTCPSPRMLSVVLGELATFYIRHYRFYEAAEVYIEAGQYREAIDCLLRGHFYQDAYHCYQEMFKKQPNFENYTNLTDVMYSGDTTARASGNQQVQKPQQKQLQKSSILSLFKKKKDDGQEQDIIMSDHNMKKSGSEFFGESFVKSHPKFPPLKSDESCPFDFCENQLTIDDYINFFLLHLYLYDPVKYEYPSPIIPIPKQCMVENLGDHESQEEECLSGGGGTSSKFIINHNLLATELSSPFIDMINSRWIDRDINDVIELNHLLETLYLSYRNELRPSLDNEYSDFDIIKPLDDDDEDGENEVDVDQEVLGRPKLKSCLQTTKKPDGSEDSEETEFADEDSFSSIIGTSTRYDSSDDDNPQISNDNSKHHHHSKTLTVPGMPSLGLKLLETGDLDDISARLKRLVNRRIITISNSNMKEINLKESMEHRVQKKLEEMETKWIKKNVDHMNDLAASTITVESSSSKNDGIRNIDYYDDENDEEQLRQQIACHLYPFLNGNQIQLLYDILEEKD